MGFKSVRNVGVHFAKTKGLRGFFVARVCNAEDENLTSFLPRVHLLRPAQEVFWKSGCPRSAAAVALVVAETAVTEWGGSSSSIGSCSCSSSRKNRDDYSAATAAAAAESSSPLQICIGHVDVVDDNLKPSLCLLAQKETVVQGLRENDGRLTNTSLLDMSSGWGAGGQQMLSSKFATFPLHTFTSRGVTGTIYSGTCSKLQSPTKLLERQLQPSWFRTRQSRP